MAKKLQQQKKELMLLKKNLNEASSHLNIINDLLMERDSSDSPKKQDTNLERVNFIASKIKLILKKNYLEEKGKITKDDTPTVGKGEKAFVEEKKEKHIDFKQCLYVEEGKSRLWVLPRSRFNKKNKSSQVERFLFDLRDEMRKKNLEFDSKGKESIDTKILLSGNTETHNIRYTEDDSNKIVATVQILNVGEATERIRLSWKLISKMAPVTIHEDDEFMDDEVEDEDQDPIEKLKGSELVKYLKSLGTGRIAHSPTANTTRFTYALELITPKRHPSGLISPQPGGEGYSTRERRYAERVYRNVVDHLSSEFNAPIFDQWAKGVQQSATQIDIGIYYDYADTYTQGKLAMDSYQNVMRSSHMLAISGVHENQIVISGWIKHEPYQRDG